jgi:transposase
MESVLNRVVTVFGAARPHHAYLFSNRRANRIKVLVHDGIGVWLAARRLTRVASSGRLRAAAR